MRRIGRAHEHEHEKRRFNASADADGHGHVEAMAGKVMEKLDWTEEKDDSNYQNLSESTRVRVGAQPSRSTGAFLEGTLPERGGGPEARSMGAGVAWWPPGGWCGQCPDSVFGNNTSPVQYYSEVRQSHLTHRCLLAGALLVIVPTKCQQHVERDPITHGCSRASICPRWPHVEKLSRSKVNKKTLHGPLARQGSWLH